MNGEDLLYDYQHFVVDPPTEWAFNWDYSEGGTAHPIPKENHATVFMTMNLDDPIAGMRLFCKNVEKSLKNIKFKIKPPNEDDHYYEFTAKNKRTQNVVIQGQMKKPSETGEMNDPNVGNYATFSSSTGEGFALLQTMVERSIIPGRIALIPHIREEHSIGNGYRVVSITGMGEDKPGLATRFQLFHEDEEAGRCLLTYRDGSYDASMGPTIEMIAVKQSRRGEGLAKILWYHVRRFIETYFTIECLNNDIEPEHVMIKATQIGTNEVEIGKYKDGSSHPMTFKEFLYDYCGFSVREQKGIMAFMLASTRPKDEEAVLFIPLLKPGAPSRMKEPKLGKATYKENIGKRMCLHCSKVSLDMLRCARCGVAYYCGADCQRKDWKNRHKLWCKKSLDEVRKTMIEQGALEITPDGNDVLCMNYPGRTFRRGGIAGK